MHLSDVFFFTVLLHEMDGSSKATNTLLYCCIKECLLSPKKNQRETPSNILPYAIQPTHAGFQIVVCLVLDVTNLAKA